MCMVQSLELLFAMNDPVMYEVFWEALESFDNMMNLCVTLEHSQQTVSQVTTRSSSHTKGAPLQRCLGTVEFTKIHMSRSGGP